MLQRLSANLHAYVMRRLQVFHIDLEVTQNAAAELALNPKAQVVAPVMYQAFRQADMRTNICTGSLQGVEYRLKDTFS